MGTEIIDVKVIGLCSKHRMNKEYGSHDIMTYKDGSIIPDEDISCVECQLREE